MDTDDGGLRELVAYEVAEVTAAATYLHRRDLYLEFQRRADGIRAPARPQRGGNGDYELVIEEEAYPFEERAIEVHEKNYELLATGIFNPWVQK